jgi:23S rRNA pseudouridine955/2504/2580 synthase
MPDAETALLLYDRYFPGNKPRPVSDLAGFPCAKQGLRAVMTNRRRATYFAAARRCRSGAINHNYKRMNELSKDAVTWLTVGEESAGQRIDNFLTRILKGVPKSHVYRILRTGEVRVNRGRVGAETRLVLGDVVRVPPVRVAKPATSLRPIPKTASKVPILYEDDAILAIDKPAGLAVHGGSGIAYGLIEQLRGARADARFLELVHRLDRDTSGVLLVAKKRAALVALHDQLRNGEFDKRYLVLVRGRWRDAKRSVRLSLRKFATREGERRVRVDEGGREAETVFYRHRIWPDHDPPLALLEAELRTGRTHQIRVHLTHLGFPLAGDAKYGDFAWNKALAKGGLRRMFLHAWKLSFVHPSTGQPLAVESELPSDLASYVAQLGGVAGRKAGSARPAA